MKLITLIENTTLSPDLAAEHGLSLWVEAAGKKFLFDAGQSGAFADNARKLGVDLKTADFAILSHGHYDHGGGMARFRRETPHAPIYANRHSFEPHFHGPEKYIGLPSDFPEAIVTGDRLELAPGLTLCTCNSLPRPHPFGAFGLTVGTRPDPFLHEQYLLVEEDGKRILLSGCSHKGILNLLCWFRPDILIGGLHLSKLDPAERELAAIVRTLDASGTAFYTGHCTGRAQFEFLKGPLGERLQAISTGTVLEL